MSQPSPDAVRQQLAEQVAFYMSDTNLITDDYMLRHLACHDWVLPLLVIAPFKLVDRFLLQLGAWSSLHDRLAELQRAVRACPDLELCGPEQASFRRRTPISPAVLEIAAAAAEAVKSIAAAEAEEAAAAGVAAAPRSTFKAVLLPPDGRVHVVHLPRRPDYLHALSQVLGGSSLLPITQGPNKKAREAMGVRIFARIDPRRGSTPASAADADAAPAAADAADADADAAPLNALASELSGLQLRGAAVVANVHLRYGKLLAADTGLADLELLVAERRGPLGLASRRLGWPCLSSWQLPRLGAWPVGDPNPHPRPYPHPHPHPHSHPNP